MTKYEIIMQIVREMPSLYNIPSVRDPHELLHIFKYAKLCAESNLVYLPLGSLEKFDAVMCSSTTTNVPLDLKTLQYKFKFGSSTSVPTIGQFQKLYGPYSNIDIFDYGFENSKMCNIYSSLFQDSYPNIEFTDMSEMFEIAGNEETFKIEVKEIFDPYHKDKVKYESLVNPILELLKNR